ncbi:hypothetical protein Pst134EA_027960 [Puccinia striiformis f. sp. tritici]|uniref:hypothetical protein n=1 Tax=Puccinia striiformis f. sp. tritici TaxID=168172 RepID=UPI002007B764|nr:hypothetical protein Pst134EA_027960 [Puccinia striiformis f. sp. tritici]KAH9448664.1 hypothetical protein Pst134EA_027960 [Puccinia striiformis f. sp. tritici]
MALSAVAGAFIPGVRNPDIGSMEHIPKEFADAISTQPAYTTDHMMFAEQTHLIQGAQASQGAQTVGMPNRNSILAGITPEIWSNWDFDAVGPSRNDHIGPMDHNQQLQPHGLFRKPAHLYLPVMMIVTWIFWGASMNPIQFSLSIIQAHSYLEP